MMDEIGYCNDLINYSRFETREVKVGNIGIGGNNPIRIQSMTTTDTMDTQATVEQSIRMIEAGCELVRITAPSKREAENLGVIKAELVKRGYHQPLIADIHFTPNAAEIAAKLIEKVRVNPGNYADKKKFDHIEYTDESYQAEIDRIFEKFSPLVKICKAHGTAMRIGTNHGSLSDRILSRFGDTPEGMVESAMEFLRICQYHDYHQIVLSMKASNPKVMVQAYRLLVATMKKEGMNYPLHLGVTEAGEGEDGRIKSAVGIGTLLADGIGDTVRVSLTEEPEAEAPVAKALVDRYSSFKPTKHELKNSNWINPFQYQRLNSQSIDRFGGDQPTVVIANLKTDSTIKPAHLFPYGYQYSVPLDKWNITDQAVDFLFLDNKEITFEIPGTLGIIQPIESFQAKPQHYPLFNINNYQAQNSLHFLSIKDWDDVEKLKSFSANDHLVLVIESIGQGFTQTRSLIQYLHELEIDNPTVIKINNQDQSFLDFQLNTSTDIGGLLLDGLGDGCWITNSFIPTKEVVSTMFGTLQATRTRISKTEYISCPSCGRTLFDLQETTAKIRSKTDHLKGVKIGIMGCIVNGPGEMADADYGYVGSGVGKITLYKGQEVVEKAIPSEKAVDALIQLIKDHGDWVEPVSV